MNNIDIVLSDMNDKYYFDSIKLVTDLLRETDVYPGSQKRIFLSKFLYAILQHNNQIGFVSAYPEDGNILSLDLCLTDEFRNIGLGDIVLDKVVKQIENNKDYNNEYLIINKNKSHDEITIGNEIDEHNILLQDRLDEYNRHRVIDCKNKYGVLNNETKNL